MTAIPPTRRSEPLQPAQTRPSDVISFTEGALLRSVISSKRRPNLLVLCPNVDTASVAAQIEEICGAPVHVGVVAGELRLPLHAAGTWLLRDVADLSVEQQSELHEW
jgi:hypothetical protein